MTLVEIGAAPFSGQVVLVRGKPGDATGAIQGVADSVLRNAGEIARHLSSQGEIERIFEHAAGRFNLADNSQSAVGTSQIVGRAWGVHVSGAEGADSDGASVGSRNGGLFGNLPLSPHAVLDGI